MKRKLQFLCALGLLAATQTNAQVFPVNSTKVNGDPVNRINIVVLPDGFQSAQLPSFNTKVNGIQTYVFNITPFKEYARFFNVYSIDVPSVDTGVVHPGTATDVTEPAYPVTNPTTYFQSAFDNGKVHRSVVAKNSSGVYSVLNANFPMYDVPMVLVNTTEYGGTGGGYITFTVNTSANETAVHELGHSFGKLWDEYWNNMPGEHPNMTQEANPTAIVWKNWIGTGAVGIYPYGTTTPQSTWYRPHQNCKMQFLGSPLCAVCKENIIDRIYDKVRPIEAVTPDTTNTVPVASPAPVTFSFSPIRTNPNTLKYQWVLNGIIINTADTSIQLDQTKLLLGANTLTAIVTDTTLMSRTNLPSSGYMFSVQWKINNSWGTSITAINNENKFTFKLFPVPAKNNVMLFCNNETSAATADYSITTIIGSLVKKGSISLAKGEQNIPFDITGMTPGVYNLGLQGDGILINTRLIVE